MNMGLIVTLAVLTIYKLISLVCGMLATVIKDFGSYEVGKLYLKPLCGLLATTHEVSNV